MDDATWTALNDKLANGFDDSATVLRRHGLTVDAYLIAARERASRPRFQGVEALDATVEIDRRSLLSKPTPFVDGEFRPEAPSSREEPDGAGETAIGVLPNLSAAMPFKAK